jgi:hypothetical protein
VPSKQIPHLPTHSTSYTFHEQYTFQATHSKNNTEYVPEKNESLKMASRREICVGLLGLSLLRGTSQKLHGYFPKAPSLFPVTES